MKSDKAIDLNAIWAADGGPLDERRAEGLDRSSSTSSRRRSRTSTTSRTRRRSCRSTSGRSSARASCISYTDTEPGRHRPLQGRELHAAEHQVPAQPEVLAEQAGASDAGGQGGRLPVVPQQLVGQPLPSQGNAQWGGQYIPNIHSFYVAKDPAHRHYWFPPVLNVSLVPNLTNPLLSKLAVRQAIAYAIDKPKVSRLGESGYQKPANQSGVITAHLPELVRQLAARAQLQPGQGAADPQVGRLQEGLERDLRAWAGQPLSFTIKTISGFSDWDASLAVIAQELKAVGITRPCRTRTRPVHDRPPERQVPARIRRQRRSRIRGRRADARTTSCAACCSAATSARPTTPTTSPTSTDALFNQYPSASLAQQHQVIDKIQKVMVTQSRSSRSPRASTGTSTTPRASAAGRQPANPYAQPSPYQAPDMEVVLTHLRPLH